MIDDVRDGARPDGRDEAMLTDVLYAIVAFETYDVITGERRFDAVAPVIERRARCRASGSRTPAGPELRQLTRSRLTMYPASIAA